MKALVFIGLALLIDIVLFTLVIPYIVKKIIHYYQNNRTSSTMSHKQLVGGIR